MRKRFKGLVLLMLWGIGFWVFFAILTPFLENHIPAWKRLNTIQAEQGIDSGALYYSNVPQTQEAEERTRAAVAEGMAQRRATRLAK